LGSACGMFKLHYQYGDCRWTDYVAVTFRPP